jgi:hypothetical protein
MHVFPLQTPANLTDRAPVTRHPFEDSFHNARFLENNFVSRLTSALSFTNVPKIFRQFAQPSVPVILLNVGERFSIHSRCPGILSAALVSKRQHVHPIHFVVQQVEPVAWTPLRFAMQRRLEFPNLFWRY